jgi:crossover junction endodeoxyribonuclease RuvC
VVSEERGKLIPIDFGTILTFPEMPVLERLEIIYDGVGLLIDKHKPDEIATEQLFFKKNVTTAIAVGRAIGVVLLAISQHNIPWAEYTPMQVKQSVTGTGGADKKQIQFMVSRLLGLKEVPKPDDAADALAIAICHIHSAKLSKLGVKTR